MTKIPAVPTHRRLGYPGQKPYFRPRGRDHPAIAIPLDPKNPHARPRSPIHVLLHARAYPRGARSNQTARNVRQTHRRGRDQSKKVFEDGFHRGLPCCLQTFLKTPNSEPAAGAAGKGAKRPA